MPGQIAVPGLYGPDFFLWSGIVRQYTPEQVSARSQRPPYRAQWSNASMGWLDLRTLDELREVRWEELKAARDAMEFGGFEWDGSTFDSDPKAQARLQGGAQMAVLAAQARESFEVDWTLADNTVRTLDASELIAVGRALAAHIGAAHAAGRGLRTRIEACATAEELADIAWP